MEVQYMHLKEKLILNLKKSHTLVLHEGTVKASVKAGLFSRDNLIMSCQIQHGRWNSHPGLSEILLTRHAVLQTTCEQDICFETPTQRC